jgi:hypothetical protein
MTFAGPVGITDGLAAIGPQTATAIITEEVSAAIDAGRPVAVLVSAAAQVVVVWVAWIIGQVLPEKIRGRKASRRDEHPVRIQRSAGQASSKDGHVHGAALPASGKGWLPARGLEPRRMGSQGS